MSQALIVLLYIAGFVGWPVLFGALAGGLLGIEVGRARGAVGGLAGIGVGAVGSDAVTGGVQGAGNFVAYVTLAVLGTLATIALLHFLVRPSTRGQLQQSLGSILHPARAVRRQVARGRRYASKISAVRRHQLLSRRNREPTIEHAQERERRLGVQLTRVLQEAGAVFVKLGQVLSSRPDVLGEPAAEQLSVLQDSVAPADPAAIERLLWAELGRSPDELFERLHAVPLAAASIGQVHPARLRSGPEVVVKVQRPGVEELVGRDLDIILTLARRLDATADWGRRVGAADLARGFAENLRQELDYTIGRSDRGEPDSAPAAAAGQARLPSVLSDEAITKVLKACEGRDFEARRNTALVRFLTDTGCRRGEVESMTVEDTDTKTGTAVVMGAGGKSRLASMGKTAQAVRRYLVPGSGTASRPTVAVLGARGRLFGNGMYM